MTVAPEVRQAVEMFASGYLVGLLRAQGAAEVVEVEEDGATIVLVPGLSPRARFRVAVELVEEPAAEETGAP